MNKGRGKTHRIFAAFLCVCMLLTLPGISDKFPAAAAGQEESFQQEKIITAFSSLPKEVKEQTVSIGTDIDELKLPAELTVYLSRESSKQIEEESGQESTEQENNGGSDDIEENSDTENENGQDIQPKGSALFGEQEETSVISGVTWQSKPAYDGNTKGTYLFSAVLSESYTLAENVSLPEITVTVIDEEPAALQQIGGWHFDEENVYPKGDLFCDEGSYSLVLAGGSSDVQISFEDIISIFPESVTVEYTNPEAGNQVLAVRGWSCPEYTQDEEGNLPYRGSFFFQALLEEEGEGKEYVFSEETGQVGVWVIFDEPMLSAVAANPGTITSNQEWGAQTLTAGTYIINPGVTVTVSGKLTVSGNVTIKGGGKLVRAGSYAGSSSDKGSYSTLIDVVYGGSLTMENITLDGNSVAAYGPAVYISSGTVTMNSGAVIQNNYNMNTGTTGTCAAGGIYCGGTLNINGGVIQSCKTSGEIGNSVYTHAGGGIYLKGTCNMTSGSILKNSASNGGGIYLASGAELNLKGGKISGNSAQGEGAGIYYSTVNNADGKLGIGGDANISDIIFLDITSGTLYPYITSTLHYKVTLKCNSTEAGKVLAKGSDYTLTGVDSSKIFMANSNLYSVLDKANNQIILSTTEEAEATWQETAQGEWKTGRFTTALEKVYSGGTIKLLKDIVFTEKVEITKPVTITSQNSANPYTITRMPTGVYGNITLIGSGSLTLTNIIYDGNRDYISTDAVKQSLIKIGNNASDTGAKLTLGNGCTIFNGYKSGGSGVIAVYGTMTMNSGAVIENCEVTGTGGAVWVSSSGTFTMNGGTIKSCKAGNGGSAVSVDGVCNLNGGSLTENTDTSSMNCAVYLRSSGSGSLTLKGVTISRNTYSVYNNGKSVTVAGDSTLSGSIYTTNAISASGNGVSGLTKLHTILMSSVASGTTVVTGSTDNTHYKLDSTAYALITLNKNLIAATIYQVTYNKNSGTITNESNYTSYISGVGLTLPTPTRTGYTFGGWYKTAER